MNPLHFSGRLASAWDRVHTSYWFLPSLLALASVALAAATLRADLALETRLADAWPWLARTDAAGARSVLSTIAGSMITVAGVVFSITIVALTLASSQFGPRLLRNLLGDRGNQVVLGTFVAVFLYCLIVLRMVGGTAEAPFVPHLSVLVAMALAVASLGVLIFFIHHVTRTIRSTHVVDTIARQIEAGVSLLFPEALGHDAGEDDERPDRLDLDAEHVRTVTARSDGYVRAIENEALMQLACERDVRIRLLRRPGDMVYRGTPLAEVEARGRDAEAAADAVLPCFVLGDERTPVQDLALLFEELAEIAVRALSPGINDPKTARECVDGATRGLVRLVDRAYPSAVRLDPAGVARIEAPTPSFEGFLAVSLDPVHRHAVEEPTVLGALLNALGELARRAPSRERLASLRARTTEILERAERQGFSERDRAVLRRAAEDGWQARPEAPEARS